MNVQSKNVIRMEYFQIKDSLFRGKSCSILYAEPYKVPFVYERCLGGQRVIVALNPSSKPSHVLLSDIKVNVPLLVQEAKLTDGILEMEPISFGVFLTGD